MPSVVVVYHSGLGHTKVIAEHVAKGARGVTGTQVDLISVEELPGPDKDKKLGRKWALLNAADAIVFG